MSALKIQNTLSEIERNMKVLAPYRKPALFNDFLINGYSAITLNSVSKSSFSEILRAKLCLGTLITLYDDLADRPTQRNPQLLESLYRLNFCKCDSIRSLDPHEQKVLDFAYFLFSQIEKILKELPHYQYFVEILNFDLAQFYLANQYSTIVTANPYFNNILENRLYAHHNMGMVMVSMMDLMATKKIMFLEFGTMREIFLIGQRMGRIFNVLTTHNREVLDGDITGELATCKNKQEVELMKNKLQQEIYDLHNRILSFDIQITTFSVKTYLEGLTLVEKLHKRMENTL